MKSNHFILGALAALVVGGALATETYERHAYGRFEKDVDAFHRLLAPLWHAPQGKQRTQDACARAGEMEGLARAIRSGDAAPLVAAVLALEKQCQGDRQEVDAALGDVHEAFHRLAEPK